MTPEVFGAYCVAACVLALLAGVAGYVLGWQDARDEQRVDELCEILDRAALHPAAPHGSSPMLTDPHGGE